MLRVIYNYTNATGQLDTLAITGRPDSVHKEALAIIKAESGRKAQFVKEVVVWTE